MTGELTRRRLLGTGGAALAVATATSGCDALSTEPSGSGDKGAGDDSGGSDATQAPALAQKVKDGSLPALGKRLPDKPLVIRPVQRAGTYGGTWHTALLGPADTSWLSYTVHYDNLVRWNREWTKTVPNIAESVDVEGDGRSYTFHLRKGMRWSDGKPFTAEDLTFAVDDVFAKKKLYPVVPTWLSPDGTVPKAEAPNRHTFRLTFTTPNGMLLANLATPSASILTQCPKHYLKQFLPAYADDVSQRAKKAGFSGWAKYYQAMSDETENPEVPTLCGWQYTTKLGKGTRMVAKRNPYYWKTDPDGRQLPYIDEVDYAIVNDEQVILLKASHGELDMHTRHITTLENKPVLARNRKAGGYHFIDQVPSKMNTMVIALNLTHKDKALREVFQNVDFRIGLSYAINRRELIKTVNQGQGEPWQAAPRQESDFYDERLAKQYTEFDVGKANRHLDRAGYTDRDGDGFRLRPDGERIRFTVETITDFGKTWIDGMQLVKRYWKAVGVDINVHNEDRTLFYERKEANSHDANVWGGDGGLRGAMMDPRWYFPYSTESNFAPAWAAWYSSGGSEGEKPPAATRRQMDLYHQLAATADEKAQAKLFRQILRIAREQFYAIGTILPTEGYGIVVDDFHNVPKSMPSSPLYGTPGPTNPEQYFMDQG